MKFDLLTGSQEIKVAIFVSEILIFLLVVCSVNVSLFLATFFFKFQVNKLGLK